MSDWQVVGNVDNPLEEILSPLLGHKVEVENRETGERRNVVVTPFQSVSDAIALGQFEKKR